MLPSTSFHHACHSQKNMKSVQTDSINTAIHNFHKVSLTTELSQLPASNTHRIHNTRKTHTN
jgi:hypothetical protein